MNQRRQGKTKKNPAFLVAKEVERGERNLIKEGNARCVFVPQKPFKAVLRSIPLNPLKVDDNDSPLSKNKFKVKIQVSRKETK